MTFQLYIIVKQNPTTRLMALCPGRPGWADTRKNIRSLTSCLCSYYKHL